MLREFEFGGEQLRIRSDESVTLVLDHFGGDRFAVVFSQHRLVVKKIELARSARLEKINHPLRLRFDWRRFRRERIDSAVRRGRCENFITLQQRGQSERADTDPAFAEKIAPGDGG